jgi:hypothetical protein
MNIYQETADSLRCARQHIEHLESISEIYHHVSRMLYTTVVKLAEQGNVDAQQALANIRDHYGHDFEEIFL